MAFFRWFYAPTGRKVIAKNAGTVPGYSTSKITNQHSTIINPSLAIPACQRLPKKRPKRNRCLAVLIQAFG
jgi:hypothetical protein